MAEQCSEHCSKRQRARLGTLAWVVMGHSSDLAMACKIKQQRGISSRNPQVLRGGEGSTKSCTVFPEACGEALAS
jgi:hypothetical protein